MSLSVRNFGSGEEAAPDAHSWTSVSTGLWSSGYCTFCFGMGRFVGIQTSMSSPVQVYSDDGVNWASGSSSEAMTGGVVGIAYSDELRLFTAVSRDNFWYSTDGISWTKSTSIASDANEIIDVVYGNGIFVAFGGKNEASTTFYTSTNGTTWTKRTHNASSRYYSLTYGAGMFIATPYVSNSSADYLLYSKNGTSWSKFSLSTNTYGYAPVYHNGQFFIPLMNNKLLAGHSTDSFQEQTIAVEGSSQYPDFRYRGFVANGRIVIPGYRGYVSADGVKYKYTGEGTSFYPGNHPSYPKERIGVWGKGIIVFSGTNGAINYSRTTNDY